MLDIAQKAIFNVTGPATMELFSYVRKLPIVHHVMLSKEFFLCLYENYSFIFTRICLNLKEIILKGTITWSTMRQQTNEDKELNSLFEVNNKTYIHLQCVAKK